MSKVATPNISVVEFGYQVLSIDVQPFTLLNTCPEPKNDHYRPGWSQNLDILSQGPPPSVSPCSPRESNHKAASYTTLSSVCL
eukprot:16370-Amorphochlora_amoeboformis.AAC.2